MTLLPPYGVLLTPPPSCAVPKAACQGATAVADLLLPFYTLALGLYPLTLPIAPPPLHAGPKAAGQGVVEGLAKEDPERYGSGRSSPA